MAKRGGQTLHSFIMREAASTGQRKDVLTKAQRAFLVRARDATLGDGSGKGAYIWGRHEMRTANTLQRDGLVQISALSYARITDAGRATLGQL